MNSPRSLGYRLPAEWEPQQGVWLSWPTNQTTWQDCWEEVQETFCEMALRFSQVETVYINLAKPLQKTVEQLLGEAEKRWGLNRGSLQFFDHATDDAWVRDHGPIYIKRNESGEIALTDWQYNGWGGKHPYKLDNQIPSRIQQATGLHCFRETMVLEGGSIESNGVGDLLVTTDCLLNPNRNPGRSQAELERILQETLGVEKIHWLSGCIEGDDTDGHIDNLVRFFKPNGVLVAAPFSSEDSNFEMLARLEQQCRELTLKNGERLEALLLPLPEPVQYQGCPLPMSYLNFFVGNESVFIPAYGQPEADSSAAGILSQAFPGRDIVPIDCRKLIREGGALHCLTQQVPLAH